MRTHDPYVTEDVRSEAIAENHATVPLAAETATAAPAPNVRVAPAGGRPRKAEAPQDAASVQAGAAPGAWCADDAQREGHDRGDGHDRGAPAARRPGRPRSERAEQAILDAAIEAVGENGIDGVSCEDVAARAGVGKATLYRRWAGKEDLLIAAFGSVKRPLPQPHGGSVRADLIALLTVVAADIDDPRFAQQFALLHGAGERYPRLVARYREEIVEPRRELIRVVLRRGIETGELRPDFDVEVAMLLLTGAVMARGKHDPTPAAPGFVARAVDEVLLGITPR
jgi:AcrR family transcriptional regulator